MEEKKLMKAKDYSIGDKCYFYHEIKKELIEIIIDEIDLKDIEEYEDTEFEGYFFRPLKK